VICAQKQRRRDRQAEGLGGLHVDDKLELRRLLGGKISRIGALEDLDDVNCCALPGFIENSDRSS
jgi:hypothetical protein